MANVEGALRMKRAGRSMMVGGALGALLGCIGIFAVQLGHLRLPLMLFGDIAVCLGFLPLGLGLVVWVCGWIVEGFVAPELPKEGQS